MPVMKTGDFRSFKELKAHVDHHRSMAEIYLRICPIDDPRRPRAEALAAIETAKATEIEREYLQ